MMVQIGWKRGVLYTIQSHRPPKNEIIILNGKDYYLECLKMRQPTRWDVMREAIAKEIDEDVQRCLNKHNNG